MGCLFLLACDRTQHRAESKPIQDFSEPEAAKEVIHQAAETKAIKQFTDEAQHARNQPAETPAVQFEPEALEDVGLAALVGVVGTEEGGRTRHVGGAGQREERGGRGGCAHRDVTSGQLSGKV